MVQDACLTSPFEYHFHPCPPTDYSYLLSALRAATECQWGAEAQLSSLSRRRFGRSILVVFSCFFPSPPSHISKFSASRAIFHTQLLEGDLIQSDDHAFNSSSFLISTPFPFGCLDRCGPFMIPSCQNPAFVFIGILILSVLVKKGRKKKKSYCFFVHDISPSICLLPPSNFSFPHFSYSHMPNHDCLFRSFSKIFQHGSFINGVWCLLYIDMCVCLYLYLHLLLFSQLTLRTVDTFSVFSTLLTQCWKQYRFLLIIVLAGFPLGWILLLLFEWRLSSSLHRVLTLST